MEGSYQFFRIIWILCAEEYQAEEWDPHRVYAWFWVLHQFAGRSFLSSSWRFQQSEHTSHLPPPFMAYDHGENNINHWYEGYTDSGTSQSDGRTFDRVQCHIILEAVHTSSSSSGTSPPCVGSDRRSVLVQFQFFEGARVTPQLSLATIRTVKVVACMYRSVFLC